MKKTNTVLVLGAGASHAYGYPLGSQLRERILRLDRDEALRAGIIKADSGEARSLENFVSDFRNSRLYSIDAFLGRRREFSEIGKRAIASILLQCESQRAFTETEGDNWYDYLINEVSTENWEDLDFSKLSVVTFNYDRSLEEFLYRALRSGYGKSPKETSEKLSLLNIVHVYGVICSSLPSELAHLPYEGDTSFETVTAASSLLQVIPDGRIDSETLVAARDLLRQAHNIAYLGFGFDPINVERLSEDGASHRNAYIDHTNVRKFVTGTAKGLRPSEVSGAYERLSGEMWGAGGEYALVDDICGNVLRNTLILRR